jgi:hypothetical protein
VEALAEPDPEHVPPGRAYNGFEDISAISLRRSSDHIAQGNVVEEERDAAQLKLVLTSLSRPELLESRGAVALRQLRVDYEISRFPLDGLIVNNELPFIIHQEPRLARRAEICARSAVMAPSSSNAVLAGTSRPLPSRSKNARSREPNQPRPSAPFHK